MFWIVVTLLTVGFVGFAVVNKKPATERLGVEQPDQGRDHIEVGQEHEPYNSDLPSSGPHYSNSQAPARWGIHDQELPPEVFVHNLEHGGIVVAYHPDLPADQIKKIKELFGSPFSDSKFKPSKPLVFPRAKNSKPIMLAGWRRTLNLDNYDEEKLKQFYLTNVGIAPEGSVM